MRKEKIGGRLGAKKNVGEKKKTQQKSGERKKRIYIKQPQTHTHKQPNNRIFSSYSPTVKYHSFYRYCLA